MKARTTELLMAIEHREVQGLSAYFDKGAAPPGLAQLASGPLVFRGSSVQWVKRSGESQTWVVDYEVEVNDYPSALFCFLVRPNLLEQTHLLRPYEKTLKIKGRLYWRQVGGTWKIVSRPPPHEPVGRACFLAQAMDAWHKKLPPEAKGVSAMGRLLALINQTEDPNHSGALGRADTLRELNEKVRRAEGVGASTVLQDRFLPGRGESAAASLEILSVLDTVLFAWWRGEIERQAGLLSAAGQRGFSAEELALSPVRLHSYEILTVAGRTSDSYAVTARLTLSDPASVCAVLACPHEVPDPRGQISLVDQGFETVETFLLLRSGGGWVLSCDADQGALGYLATAGTARRLVRITSPEALPSDPFGLAVQLGLRFTLLRRSFDGLRLEHVRAAIGGEGAKHEELLRQMVQRVQTLTADARELGQFSREELCYYLGRKIGEYVTGTVLEASMDEARLGAKLPALQQELAASMDKVAAIVFRLVRALDLGMVDSARFEELLRRLRAEKDFSLVAEGSDEIEQMIRARHSDALAAIYQIGFDSELAAVACALGDAASAGEGEDSVRLWLVLTLTRMLRNLSEVPGAKQSARVQIGHWLDDALAGRALPGGEAMNVMEKFEWLLEKPAGGLWAPAAELPEAPEAPPLPDDRPPPQPRPAPPWDVRVGGTAVQDLDIPGTGGDIRPQYRLELTFENHNAFPVAFDRVALRLHRSDMAKAGRSAVSEVQIAWYEQGRIQSFTYGDEPPRAPGAAVDERLGALRPVELEPDELLRCPETTLGKALATCCGAEPTVVSVHLFSQGDEVGVAYRAALPPLAELPRAGALGEDAKGPPLAFAPEVWLPQPAGINDLEVLRRVHRKALSVGSDGKDYGRIRLMRVFPAECAIEDFSDAASYQVSGWQFEFWSAAKTFRVAADDVENVAPVPGPPAAPPAVWIAPEALRRCVIDCDVAVLIAATVGAQSQSHSLSLGAVKVGEETKIAWLVPRELDGQPLAVVADTGQVLVQSDSQWRVAEGVIWNGAREEDAFPGLPAEPGGPVPEEPDKEDRPVLPLEPLPPAPAPAPPPPPAAPRPAEVRL